MKAKFDRRFISVNLRPAFLSAARLLLGARRT